LRCVQVGRAMWCGRTCRCESYASRHGSQGCFCVIGILLPGVLDGGIVPELPSVALPVFAVAGGVPPRWVAGDVSHLHRCGSVHRPHAAFLVPAAGVMAATGIVAAKMHRGRRSRRREVRTVRNIFPELSAMAEMAYVWLSKPLQAPGPSEVLIARERRARQAVAKLQNVQGGTADSWELRKSAEELAEVERVLSLSHAELDQYPVPEFLSTAYGIGGINVAVTGASGVGKSSFINAVRRLNARDAASARTGITETTSEPEMFTFDPGTSGIFRKAFEGVGRIFRRFMELEDEEEIDKAVGPGDRVMITGMSADLNGRSAEVISANSNNMLVIKLDDGKQLTVSKKTISSVLANCKIWDLPGAGTPRYPQATYLRRMGIRHFDVVVLMTASRFTEAELMLMEELRRWMVPYFLVRSKIDFDIEAEIEDQDEVCEIGQPSAKPFEDATIKTVKDFFRSSHSQDKIYCISSRAKYRSRFDFLELERDMQTAIKAQRVVDSRQVRELLSWRP